MRAQAWGAATLLFVALARDGSAQPGVCSYTAGGPDGLTWVLLEAAGVQQATGPGGSTGTWDYFFNVCENINPVPQICLDNFVLGTAALRSNANQCEQLAPDINVPGGSSNVVVTSLEDPEGVQLEWNFFGTIGTPKTFTLIINCAKVAGEPNDEAGSEPNDPLVTWLHPAGCHPDGPGPPGDGSNWGWFFIGFTLFGAVGYAAGGYYHGTSKQGKKGKEALPHFDFWAGLPGMFADGGASPA